MKTHNSYQEFVDKVRKVTESLFDDCIEVILKNEKEPQEINIYQNLWHRMNLNNIYHENLTLQIFDCGVDCGEDVAIKMIQKFVGVTQSGEMDCETTIAINDYQGGDLLDMYRQDRKKYYYSQVRNSPELAPLLKSKMDRVEKTKFA